MYPKTNPLSLLSTIVPQMEVVFECFSPRKDAGMLTNGQNLVASLLHFGHELFIEELGTLSMSQYALAINLSITHIRELSERMIAPHYYVPNRMCPRV